MLLLPGLSCSFEDGLCGWYQDNSDNFDWAVTEGMDHTVGIGELIINRIMSESTASSTAVGRQETEGGQRRTPCTLFTTLEFLI